MLYPFLRTGSHSNVEYQNNFEHRLGYICQLYGAAIEREVKQTNSEYRYVLEVREPRDPRDPPRSFDTEFK